MQNDYRFVEQYEAKAEIEDRADWRQLNELNLEWEQLSCPPENDHN